MPRSSLKKLLKPLTPLIGEWTYTGDSQLGPLKCTRTFAPILNGHRLQLTAIWTYEDPKRADYEEYCLFGATADGALGFVSFINDGGRSEGVAADVSDIDKAAIGFEAEMPHGLARQVYWPDGEGGLNWRVERKVKAGWSMLAEHRYTPAA